MSSHAPPPDHGRRSEDRRSVGGRRKTDELPRATVTRKGIAVIVAAINFAYLVVEALGSNCVNWFH